MKQVHDVEAAAHAVLNALVVRTDLHGRVAYVSATVAEILETSTAELIGQSWIERAVPPRSWDFERQKQRDVLTDPARATHRYVGRIQAAAGRRHTILWLAQAEAADAGILACGIEVTSTLRRVSARAERTARAAIATEAREAYHQIVNVIAGVGGALAILTAKLPAERAPAAMLAQIEARLASALAAAERLLDPRDRRA